MTPAPVIQLRAGQRRLFRLVDTVRLLAFVARRQYGKTTTFAAVAVKKMMQRKDHTVIFGSAKLNLSREIVRKEAAVLEAGIAAAAQRARDAGARLVVADATAERVPDALTDDDFAELYEASRLEFRYYHSRGSYSRTKVVALRPDAVGETGDLMCDEVGRIANWREVWEAVEPIVAANPDYRLLLSTTPPPDDAHYSFEQLAPPPGSRFEIRPDGNVYESIRGVTVVRVSADDAAADAVPLYNLKTGDPETPAENRAAALDKDAWDRNYGCAFVTGGTAAIGLLPIMDAQAEGERLGCLYIEDDLPANLDGVAIPGAPLAIGLDPATTEREHSNPFGVAVVQRVDGLTQARLLLSLKSADPRKPRGIIRELAARLKPCAIAIDASSETYWATEIRQELQGVCPVLLLKGGARIDAGGEKIQLKTYLGNLGCAPFEDGRAALPPAPQVKDDFRLVRRFRGGFDNDLDRVTGRHGDLFDAWKSAIYALQRGAEKVDAEAVQVATRAFHARATRDAFRLVDDDQAPTQNERMPI